MDFRLKANNFLRQKKIFKDNFTRTLRLEKFSWAIEPWPFYVPFIILIFHISVLLFISDIRKFNTALGSILQIAGASVVLWGIAQNLGLLEGKNFCIIVKEVVKDWWERKPTGRPRGTIITTTQNLSLEVKEAPLQDQLQFNTVEEKVDYLLKRSVELEEKFNRIRNSLAKRINEVEKELNQTKKSFKREVDGVKTTLKSAVLGGMKMEIAGFLTAAYGVLISGFFG
ncbi:hypothetical protein [Trichloromonas acetexigens]|nr:hypothetical protein [Desulfuromonas acetexigens]